MVVVVHKDAYMRIMYHTYCVYRKEEEKNPEKK